MSLTRRVMRVAEARERIGPGRGACGSAASGSGWRRPRAGCSPPRPGPKPYSAAVCSPRTRGLARNASHCGMWASCAGARSLHSAPWPSTSFAGPLSTPLSPLKTTQRPSTPRPTVTSAMRAACTPPSLGTACPRTQVSPSLPSGWRRSSFCLRSGPTTSPSVGPSAPAYRAQGRSGKAWRRTWRRLRPVWGMCWRRAVRGGGSG
mmetsp:Transcript_4041/g.12141  ORF Transcript_4041/g.12141 Transcript_4041/m.12141 type:complete len:205 (-) Transcript_4041:120-734(-)